MRASRVIEYCLHGVDQRASKHIAHSHRLSVATTKYPSTIGASLDRQRQRAGPIRNRTVAERTFIVEMNHTQACLSTFPFRYLEIGVIELGLRDQVKVSVRIGWLRLGDHSRAESLEKATGMKEPWSAAGCSPREGFEEIGWIVYKIRGLRYSSPGSKKTKHTVENR